MRARKGFCGNNQKGKGPRAIDHIRGRRGKPLTVEVRGFNREASIYIEFVAKWYRESRQIPFKMKNGLELPRAAESLLNEVKGMEEKNRGPDEIWRKIDEFQEEIKEKIRLSNIYPGLAKRGRQGIFVQWSLIPAEQARELAKVRMDVANIKMGKEETYENFRERMIYWELSFDQMCQDLSSIETTGVWGKAASLKIQEFQKKLDDEINS
ncbi:MAG: hypothetical protein ABID38_02175 [Candidatus Diapherotrites archaeon]